MKSTFFQLNKTISLRVFKDIDKGLAVVKFGCSADTKPVYLALPFVDDELCRKTAPQFLSSLFDLKVCLVIMSVRLFFIIILTRQYIVTELLQISP